MWYWSFHFNMLIASPPDKEKKFLKFCLQLLFDKCIRFTNFLLD